MIKILLVSYIYLLPLLTLIFVQPQPSVSVITVVHKLCLTKMSDLLRFFDYMQQKLILVYQNYLELNDINSI